jgi:hypothetical protein
MNVASDSVKNVVATLIVIGQLSLCPCFEVDNREHTSFSLGNHDT